MSDPVVALLCLAAGLFLTDRRTNGLLKIGTALVLWLGYQAWKG